RRFVLAPLQRLGISSNPSENQASDMSLFSTLLMGMSGLVLVIACLNLANLLLARGGARRRERAIRQALGSGGARIIRQLLVEGLVLSVAGAAIGLVLSSWTTGALTAGIGASLPIVVDVEPSFRVVAAAAGLALGATFLFGLGPAWTVSRPSAT